VYGAFLQRDIVKTRIIHTKFWDDDVVENFSPWAKYLFLYLLTNHRIGLTGVYEITDRVMLFDTGLSKDQLNEAKEELQAADRVRFYENWVYVVNAQKNNGYFGEKLDPAVKKEFNRIPKGILDTLSIHYLSGSDLLD